MTPFYFGTGQHRLYAVYDPAAADAGVNPRAVVLCYPWGPEYVYAHRALRHLATRLSLAGFHTLRFDYFGTGDSTGEITDADLSGWQNDIEAAVEELIDSTGVKQVALVGLRLGAALAASVAMRRHDQISSLVLWDPVVSGVPYLEELADMSRRKTGKTQAIGQTGLGGDHEILGFSLTEKMAEEIKKVDLIAMLSALPTDTMILISHQMPWHDKLQKAVREQQENLPLIQYADDAPAWIASSNNAGIVPVDTLNIVTNWLEQCN